MSAAASEKAPARAVEVGHQPVDDDRHGDRGEDEGARDGGHRRQPVAECHVEHGQGWEHAQPDHQGEVMAARRRAITHEDIVAFVEATEDLRNPEIRAKAWE